MDDYEVIRARPDIGRERFIEILMNAKSPAAGEAGVMYDAIVRHGVSPAFALAVFRHESLFGLAGVTQTHRTLGIGNVRSVHSPENGGVVIDTARGPFVRYPSWELGARDWAQRIRGEKYEGAGLRTVRQIIPRYAPASDGNNPEGYISSVLAFIGRESTPEVQPMPDDAINLRLAYVRPGAANRPGRKIEARYVTVHETANTNSGATADMHRAFVHAGGGPQLTSYNFVVDDKECIALIPVGESSNHAGTAEGNGSGISIELCVNGRIDGPEWVECQRRGAALVAHLYRHVLSLLPMDEGLVYHGRWRSTACPARLRANGEAGWQAFRADVAARLTATEPQPPPAPTVVKIGDHWVGGGFLVYYQSAGADALEYFGYPMTEEMPLRCEDGETRTCQVFERCIMEHHPDAPDAYTVQLRRLGAEWLADHQAPPAPIPPQPEPEPAPESEPQPSPAPPPKPPSAAPYPPVVTDGPGPDVWLHVKTGMQDKGVSVTWWPAGKAGAGDWPDRAQWLDTSYPGRADGSPDWLKLRQAFSRYSIHPAVAEALLRVGGFDRITPATGYRAVPWEDAYRLAKVDDATAGRIVAVGRALAAFPTVRAAFDGLGLDGAALASTYRCLRRRVRDLSELSHCGRET